MRYKNTGRTLSLMVAMVFLLSSFLTVFADVNIGVNTNDMDEMKNAMTAASSVAGSKEVSDDTVKVKSSSGNAENGEVVLFKLAEGKLVFYDNNFDEANLKDVKSAMTAFINSLKDSSLDADTQKSIMTQIQESNTDVAALMIPIIFDNTKADLFTAYKWLYPFLQLLRVVFGLGSVFIILVTIGSTIMDMVYIGLPVWREQQADKQAEKGGQSNKLPFGVSYEALGIVRETEKNLGDGSYQNAYLMYFKHRAMTYIILSICLLYLIAGELGGLIAYVLKLVGGVVS